MFGVVNRRTNSMLVNPLTAKDELSRHANLTFLWSWTSRRVPRRVATHAPFVILYHLLHNKSKNSENWRIHIFTLCHKGKGYPLSTLYSTWKFELFTEEHRDLSSLV